MMGPGILILPFSRLSEYENEKEYRVHAHWEEKARAARSEQKRIQEAAAGVLAAHLEEILGRSLEIGTGEHGKPYARTSGRTVYFNISHTKGLAVLAYSENTEVGVDTERIRKAPEKIADRFFTGEEREFLREDTEDGKDAERFFRIWTAKEACMKFSGVGLLLSPERISLKGLSCGNGPDDLIIFRALIDGGGMCSVSLTQHLFQTGPDDRYVITAAWGECLSEPLKIDII